MAYEAEISRATPGCIMFLIDQSGSMADKFADSPETQLAAGVADAINRLLENLTIKCSKGEKEVRYYFDIGVIGYGAQGATSELEGRDLVPISELGANPRIEKRKKKESDGAGGIIELDVDFPVWFDPVANGGTPMCQALVKCQQIVDDWAQNHPKSYPPIVINITDGEATDGDPSLPAREIVNLSTDDGNVLMFNCHISSRPGAKIVFPSDSSQLPDEFAKMLFNMSSLVPEGVRNEALKEGIELTEQARGFAFNADLVDLIQFLDIGTRSGVQQIADR